MRYSIIALMLLSSVLLSTPLVQAAQRNLGFLCLNAGEPAEAAAHFQSALEWGATLGMMRGGPLRAAVLGRDFYAAEELASQISLRDDEVLSGWLLNMASKWLDAGDIPSTRCTLDLISKYGPVEAEIQYRTGLLHERAGAKDQAQRAYTIGAQHDPDGLLAKGWYYLARLQYLGEEWQQVVELLTPILTTAPNSALNVGWWREAFLFLAGSEHRLGQIVEAEQTYRDLVALDPISRDWVMHFGQINLGDAEIRRGNWMAAQGYFAIAYDCAVVVPEHSREVYEERAWRRLAGLAEFITSQGQTAEALALVQQSMVVDPNSPGWRILLGLLYEKRCELTNAREVYMVAQALAPQAVYLPKQLERLRSNRAPCPHTIDR